jgi:hypothetical protein
MWPVGYQSEEWICSLNSLNMCPVLFGASSCLFLGWGSVTIVPVGAGTCRSMCGEVQVHSSVMESEGLLSLDMGGITW